MSLVSRCKISIRLNDDVSLEDEGFASSHTKQKLFLCFKSFCRSRSLTPFTMALSLWRWLIFAIVSLNGVSSQNIITDWWDHTSMYFGWGMSELAYFNDKYCSIPAETFHFGGTGVRSKWIFGGKVLNILAKGPIEWMRRTKEKLKRLVGQEAMQKMTAQQMWDLRRGGTDDFLGNFVGVGEKKFRYYSEQSQALMIGADYMEPCRWNVDVPKIVSFKISADISNPMFRGDFNFYIQASTSKCTSGRIGTWFESYPKPQGQDELAAWELKWKDKVNDLSYGEWKVDIKVDEERNPAIMTVSSGGVLSNPAGDKITGNGRFYTSSLFDGSAAMDQAICGIFVCKNEIMHCAVRIEEWKVSDMAGVILEKHEGTVLFNMKPLDIFTLFMAFFCLLFFFVQCFCCCQLFVLELNAGVVDEAHLMEKKLQKQYQQSKNEVNKDAKDDKKLKKGKGSSRMRRTSSGGRDPSNRSKRGGGRRRRSRSRKR